MSDTHRTVPTRGKFQRTFEWVYKFKSGGTEHWVKRTIRFRWSGKGKSRIEIWTKSSPIDREYGFFELTDNEFEDLYQAMTNVRKSKGKV